MAKKNSKETKKKVEAKKKENKDEASKVTAKMLARELTEEYDDLTIGAALEVVAKLFENVSKHIVNGKVVSVHGFGTFQTKERAARTGRNPKTGESIEIDASTGVKFKASKSFKEALNA